jgi:hypothetical protein
MWWWGREQRGIRSVQVFIFSIKDGSFSFQRILGDLLLDEGTISRPLKPIPMSKVISDKKPLS